MSLLIKTKAIVLGSIRWQESSKIVTLFTRESGKIKVIARGALRNKSPFAGQLQTLNFGHAIFSEKTTRTLQILTAFDAEDNFNTLRLDLRRLPYALAILE
ncbi:MAG: DNA repair protein RecO, partial [Caldithrix sp.]|nr:DNA repair protein RecO [Caldithrix sp.]